MNRFAELLDRLAYEPARNNKLRLITDYFRSTPDPERGWALAALTGALSFPHAKAGLIRSLIAERTDPVLFELSYDYVGDLSETVALMWPTSSPSPLVGEGGAGGREGKSQASTVVNEQSSPPSHHLPTPTPNPSPQGGGELTLTAVIETLSTLGKAQLPQQLARWLDALDETGRWALIKLVTGGLRIGVSARLAKTAVAALGRHRRAGHRVAVAGAHAALSRPVRLARRPRGKTGEQRSGAVPAADAGACARRRRSCRARGGRFLGGMEMGRHPRPGGRRAAATAQRSRGFIRAPARTFPKAFPISLDALHLPGAIDGELLIMRERRVQSFNVLQQRLNRKTVTPKLIAEFPAHLRAYDLLADGGEDLRERPFAERRARLESFRRAARRRARRPLAARPVHDLGRTHGRAQRIRRRPAPATMPRRSKASCSSGATRSTCPAGRKARGGNGSATPSSSMRC